MLKSLSWATRTVFPSDTREILFSASELQGCPFPPLLLKAQVQTSIRLTDVPATITTELGTESRFSFPDDAPPGRPSNGSAVSLTGNPDIRVPETVEIEDGLRARREETGKDADRDARTPRERPEETEGRQNTREALKTSAQDRIATKRETEERVFRHVPGGTWLNQVRS
ncbi:hypothetical protein NDU88_004853 [Pleurodeles waltl]|uniref:Uncharacterized protein n=1 Tax=Pleurodeles waltl TaxID=8319 RepID=A0AAV7QJJ6_PLEWA|nr:hypothetical protein NDU88_004853 [Pleurodeles waltl]